jgi:LemA protein
LKGRLGFLIGVGIVILVILIAVGIFCGMYNSLVTKSQAVDAQLGQVEAQYQRRYDLIPKLVNSVKGIFTQEQTVFGQISEARTRYTGATTIDEKAVASNDVESALSKLLVIIENYPELRSSQAVTSLMDELAGTENRVNFERRSYNDMVRDYNTAIKTFPRNMLAGMFGFEAREYFKSVPGADLVPKVEF